MGCPESEAVLASDFAKRFALTGTVVYRGLASTVFLGIEKDTSLQVVIKVLLKANFNTEEERRNAVDEIRIHSDMPPHRNVVHLLATEETEAAMLLVMPYTPHGDLWSLARFSQTYCETEVQNCAAQMLCGLRHVHEVGIVHTDVKPHNFLLFRATGKFSVQLCDFGLASRIKAESLQNHGVRGTSGWYSPEMLRGLDYGQAVDVFGVGLILFRMLGGYEPFMPPAAFKEPVEFDDSCWCHISAPCRDLITKLLALDPKKRITAADACQHEWIAGPPPPQPTEEQLQTLCEFGPPPREDIHFWHPGEVPEHGRQNSFAGLEAVVQESRRSVGVPAVSSTPSLL